MKRAACALLLLWAASGCRRSAPVTTGLVVAETPSQVFWSNATNRIGVGAYATVAAVVPGHPAGQLIWLDERRLAFMRLGGLDGPAEVDQAVLGAGGWSSPMAADFPGFHVTALLDGSALGGDPRRPMVVIVGDDTDWARVVGNAGLSNEALFRLQVRNRRLYSSFLAGGRWTAPLAVPDSFGAVGGALQVGPGSSAVLLVSLDQDGDPGTREDRSLAYAWFDGTRWTSPARFAPYGPGLAYGLQVTFAAGAYHLAWVVDADRDLETTGDRTVWAAVVSAGGALLQAPVAVSGPHEQPWPILGAVGGVPALVFAGDRPDQGLRPLLESRYAGGWSAPRETGLTAGAVARGQLFDEGGETLLVYEDTGALATATTRGGAWHSAGLAQDYNGQDFNLAEAMVRRVPGGLDVAALGHARAAGARAGDEVLAVHLSIAPDLAVSQVEPTERRLFIGMTVQVRVTVENRGQLFSGPFTVSLGEVSAPVPEADGLYPGETRTYALPVLVARARQHLEATVAGARPDLDPSNDRRSFDLRVQPDFTVDSIRRDGNALVAKVVDLKDVGAEPVNVDFVLVKGGAQTVLSQQTYDPSQATPVRFDWSNWPPEQEPYAVVAVVNDRTQVPEDDPDNDLGTYLHEPSIDLVVQQLEVTASTIRGTIANIGALRATSAPLLLTTDPELAVSPEPIPGTPPLFLGTVAVGTFEVPAAGLQQASGYFLYAVVNPYGTVPELNRDNNMLRISKRPAAALHPVLFAVESLRIGQGASVSGMVAVGTDGPEDNDLVIGPDARVRGDASANRVQLLPGTSVTGTVTSNGLAAGPRATSGASRSPLALPLDVPIPPVTTQPGGDDLQVSGVVDLPPGSHRDARVGPGATLRLTGGAYAFRSVALQSRARLECIAACEVRVAQTLTGAAEAFIGPPPGSPLQPRAVQVRVAGTSLRLDHGAVARAELTAPAATVVLGSEVRLEGSAIGRTVEVGHAAVVVDAPAPAATTTPLRVAIQSEKRSGGRR